MRKLNCWEFKKCDRQPGGTKVDELGVCPAAVDETADGINSGCYGGRICWAVGGTFCGGQVQGSFAKKLLNCITCNFFQEVKLVEGFTKFELLKPGQEVPSSDPESNE
jgi:hypothetical protein